MDSPLRSCRTMELWGCCMILDWLLLFFPTPDMAGPVAVHAAYVINTYQADADGCCGACKGGFITHGDGHKTPCPCPPECECKK